jgi:MFS family permease
VFLFGWLGDRVGRKYTFLITLSGMALGTGAIGLIPTFDQIGVAAAIILFCLRMLQGLCLGGQYGGAITYVAEHVSDERRGYYTGWLQTSPTLGIVLSLVVIIAVRTSLGDATFNDWAWRMPFLFSFLLVLIAYYVRVNFQESPIFEEIKAKGAMTKNPWREAFLSANIKFVVIASIVVLGQGVVWYSSQFWALIYFLPQVSKLDALTTSYIVGAGLVIGTPTLIFFGWLSDLIGRKPVILAGLLLAAVTYYPLYAWLGSLTMSTIRLRSSSWRSWSPMSGWSMGRSALFSRNISPRGSVIRRCPCRIISVTAGAADWCRSSPQLRTRRRAVSAMP